MWVGSGGSDGLGGDEPTGCCSSTTIENDGFRAGSTEDRGRVVQGEAVARAQEDQCVLGQGRAAQIGSGSDAGIHRGRGDRSLGGGYRGSTESHDARAGQLGGGATIAGDNLGAVAVALEWHGG